MNRFSTKSSHRLPIAFTVLVVLVTMLACDISLNTGQDSKSEDLAATEAALQQTQIAIQVQQQQQQAQQQSQQQGQQPPDQQQGQQQEQQQGQPLSDQPQEPPPSPDVVYEDISFSFDEGIAGGVDPDNVPGMQEQEGPPGGNYPDHITFTFTGYALQDRFHEPKIYIYPVAAYQAIEQHAIERVNGLKNILASKPADSDDALPFMPIWPAAQMIHAKIDYFDFQNGSGLRFLSQYGQAAYPVNNHDLFYTYQGITHDGAYYVAAVLPVSHPSLPANGDNVPNGDWATFSENYEAYAAQTKQMLNAQPDESFIPNLELLDDIFRSMWVK